MSNLHDPHENDNQIEFVGIVGKAGPRLTAHGCAIDVADNSVRPFLWRDVIPDDPALIDKLMCGDLINVKGRVLQDSKRPLVRGEVEILPRRQRDNPQ